MTTTMFTLEPVKYKDHYDNVLLKTEDGFPWALLHIDAFHRAGDESMKRVYEALYAGKPMAMQVTFDA